MSFHLCVFSSGYRSFTSLVKFIPRYLTVFDAIVKGSIFIISVEECDRFLYIIGLEQK